MVATEGQLAILKHFVVHKKISVTAAAHEAGLNPKTALKYAKNKFKHVEYTRKTNPVVKKRRGVLVKLAKATVKAGHVVSPKYGSSSALRAGIFRETKKVVSARQIRRDMKELGFRSYRRKKCPTRTPKDVARRRAFAKRMLSFKKCSDIVFSDETWLCCNEKTGIVQYAKCRDDVLPLERKARWNVASVLVWAAIGVGYRSPLVVFPSRHTNADGDETTFRLNNQLYIRRCLQKVVGDLLKRKKVFQQDGARAHVHKNVIRYLTNKKLDFISDWPSNSPDMNMIELLWKDLGDRVGAMCPFTEEELIRAAHKAWQEIPQASIDRTVLHFRKVCKQVAK